MEHQNRRMPRCADCSLILFQGNWSVKRQSKKNEPETEVEEQEETTDQIPKAKIITPDIYYNVYVPVKKTELKEIVEGYIEMHDQYAIQCRTEMLSLMKEAQKLTKKLIELKEAKDMLLELQRLNKLETEEWKEFTDKQLEELREYQDQYITLVKQLIKLEMIISKTVEKSETRRKQSTRPPSVPMWNQRRRNSLELHIPSDSNVIILIFHYAHQIVLLISVFINVDKIVFSNIKRLFLYFSLNIYKKN